MGKPVTCLCGECRACGRRARYAAMPPAAKRAHLERAAVRNRAWRLTHPGDRRRKKQVRDPVKKHAWNVVAGRRRRGSLTPEPCEVCGAEHVEAHHDDYTQPLAVRWLCRDHHREHHALAEGRA